MIDEVFLSTYKKYTITIVKGNSCKVWDDSGKEYIDGVSGIGCSVLGHNHEGLTQTIAQNAKLITMSNLYYTQPQQELAQKLVTLSGLSKVFFSNSGTESIECAIKLARFHTKKTDFIVMKNGFHGRTFGSLSATSGNKIKDPFAPLVEGFTEVEYNNVDAANAAITQKTAGIIVEPIQGEAGVIIPTKGYLKQLRALCDEKQILLILDEIQTGCGRTGTFFAYEQENIFPDIVCLAKGLAAGVPIGVTIAREGIDFEIGMHGSTFGGNCLSAGTGSFVVSEIVSILDIIEQRGEYFSKKLETLEKKDIKEIRMKGLMIGIELHHSAKGAVNTLLGKGIIANCAHENTIRFLPPFIISEEEINTIVAALDEVLK